MGNVEGVWVLGKVEAGWYLAKAVWDEKYAQDLRKLGYQVSKVEPGSRIEAE